MIDLTGRVALVTGSSRGIGKACALRLADAGADVILNYVTSRKAVDQVAEAIQAYGRRTAIVKADVGEQDDILATADFIKDNFGRLDILVSNAASGGFRPLLATTANQFAAAMNTNVRALLFLVQATLPLMGKDNIRSKVIGLSSHGARLALPMYGLIGSTKAALESLVRHLALEFGKSGINVNIVQAGLVETDSLRLIPEYERIVQAWQEKGLVGETHLTAQHVADVVLYLASPLSDLIQGQTIVVDGGVSVHA